MTGSPFIKPTAPELRTHLRCIRTHLAQSLKLVVDIGTRTEVHGPSQIIKTIVEEVGRPVALEETYLIKTALLHNITDSAHVRFVLTIRTIFILNLHHDDRAPILDGQRSQLLAHLFLKDFHTLHEIRILLTQTDILLLQEPPRQTAHLPLSTNVWPGTYNDVHTILLTEATESSHVIIASKIKLSLLLFMNIPEHIKTNRIHAKSLTHFDAMLPVSTRNTRIVQLGRLHDKRLAVQKKCLVTRCKGTPFLGSHHLRRRQSQQRG